MTTLLPPAVGLPSPAARRVRRPRWYDARLLAGLLLVVGSVVAGVLVVGAADRSIDVWALRHDLPAGAVLDRGDVVARPVRLFGADAARYLRASDAPPTGAVLTRAVGGGELLPAAALAPPGAAPARRVVAVPLARAHALGGDVRRGMTIDLVATYTTPGGRTTTVPVLRGVTVVGVSRPGSGFTVGKAELTLLLEVAPEDALAVAAAAASAQLDVFRVVPGPGGPGDIGAAPVVAEAGR